MTLQFHIWNEYFHRWLSFFTSIHPSIAFCLSGVGSQWQQGQQGQQGIPNILLLTNAFQLLLGDHKVFPGQMIYIIPPADSGSAVGSPPRSLCMVNLQGEAPRMYPNQMPKPPTPFQGLALLQPELLKLVSAAFICDLVLSHHPQLVAIGEVQNTDILVNWELYLLNQLALHHNSGGLQNFITHAHTWMTFFHIWIRISFKTESLFYKMEPLTSWSRLTCLDFLVKFILSCWLLFF